MSKIGICDSGKCMKLLQAMMDNPQPQYKKIVKLELKNAKESQQMEEDCRTPIQVESEPVSVESSMRERLAFLPQPAGDLVLNFAQENPLLTQCGKKAVALAIKKEKQKKVLDECPFVSDISKGKFIFKDVLTIIETHKNEIIKNAGRYTQYLCVALIKIFEAVDSNQQFEMSGTITVIQEVIVDIETTQQSSASAIKRLLGQMKSVGKLVRSVTSSRSFTRIVVDFVWLNDKQLKLLACFLPVLKNLIAIVTFLLNDAPSSKSLRQLLKTFEEYEKDLNKALKYYKSISKNVLVGGAIITVGLAIVGVIAMFASAPAIVVGTGVAAFATGTATVARSYKVSSKVTKCITDGEKKHSQTMGRIPNIESTNIQFDNDEDN